MCGHYVITGGAGFIGSSIARRLSQLGSTVTVVDDLSTGRAERLNGLGGVKLIRGDIRDRDLMDTIVATADGVFHLAAVASVQKSIEDPLVTNSVNVDGTLSVLLAAGRNQVKRVVLASSSSVYGDSGLEPLSESSHCIPKSPYAVSKLCGEMYARYLSDSGVVEAVSLRYFNVFGPGQDRNSDYAAVIPAFISDALAFGTLTVYGSGEQSRDFVFIDDVVEANIAAMRAPGISGSVLNIGSGRAVSVNELATVLSRVLNRDLVTQRVRARPGDILHSLADISLARRWLGFEPRVSLEDGLRQTLAWFREAPKMTC